MDLTDQTVSSTNEICIQDSLNASLMKLKVKMGATSVAPDSNDLIIYVDKQSSSSPTTERKQYVFNLTGPLKYCNETSDELIQQFKMVDNKVQIEAFVKRKVDTNESGNYVLETSTIEELDGSIITLFEGINYIYTNYTNGEITVIYPKDNEVTRAFLNNATYYEHLINDQDDFNLDDIYFKDAFTKSGDKLNLEVDNACVECIISKNNKFSLDSDGNLIINSINSAQELISNQNICDLIYPIGSIYLSVNSTNPSTLFGGTWVQIQDRFLIGCGSYANGTTGGNQTINLSHVHTTAGHTLTINEMPSHTHEFGAKVGGTGTASGWTPDSSAVEVSNKSGYDLMKTGGGQSHSHGNTGSALSSSQSIMPPFLAVYIWKRTA